MDNYPWHCRFKFYNGLMSVDLSMQEVLDGMNLLSNVKWSSTLSVMEIFPSALNLEVLSSDISIFSLKNFLDIWTLFIDFFIFHWLFDRIFFGSFLWSRKHIFRKILFSIENVFDEIFFDHIFRFKNSSRYQNHT